jgi:hypothetical protein
MCVCTVKPVATRNLGRPSAWLKQSQQSYYQWSLGDINPNRVKIESASNRDSLLPNYSIIDILGDMDQPRIIQFSGKSRRG